MQGKKVGGRKSWEKNEMEREENSVNIKLAVFVRQ